MTFTPIYLFETRVLKLVEVKEAVCCSKPMAVDQFYMKLSFKSSSLVNLNNWILAWKYLSNNDYTSLDYTF